MTAQEAIKLVDAALENHWLNLHEGPGPEYQKDADEFEAALALVKVVADEDQLSNVNQQDHDSARGY